MLCCSSPTACHPTAGTNCSVPVADYCTSPVSIGLLQQRLVRTSRQPHPASSVSVQNAAARLIFRIRRSEHITAALISLHRLRVPERIVFKLAVLTYRSIHSTSPGYLQSCFTRVADMTSRRRLRSSTCDRLDVPAVRLSAVGRRAFLVSGRLAPTFGTICCHT